MFQEDLIGLCVRAWCMHPVRYGISIAVSNTYDMEAKSAPRVILTMREDACTGACERSSCRKDNWISYYCNEAPFEKRIGEGCNGEC